MAGDGVKCKVGAIGTTDVCFGVISGRPKFPFVSSEVETPGSPALTKGVSTSLDTNGIKGRLVRRQLLPLPRPLHIAAFARDMDGQPIHRFGQQYLARKAARTAHPGGEV
jgi:hypothetical protein